MIRIRRASGTGSGFRSTECTTAKVAVLAAIHTASVTSTVKLNPLSRSSERTPYLTSRSRELSRAMTLIRRGRWQVPEKSRGLLGGLHRNRQFNRPHQTCRRVAHHQLQSRRVSGTLEFHVDGDYAALLDRVVVLLTQCGM